ncbi:MAG: hypothetical protein ACRDQC_15770 [Gaiellales bacterium]
MSRISRTISTIAIVVATVGLIAPAAQANGGHFPRFAPNEHVTRIVDHVPPAGASRPWIHYTPLTYAGTHRAVVNGRIATTSGGVDWMFPVMGAIAVVLIMMVAGDQLITRRRGQLAT